MKPMIYNYDINRTREVLYEGTYKGYQFQIVSLQSHPCAYVEYKGEECMDYDEPPICDIDVHGGITFMEVPYWMDTDKTFIGWDYAHYNDRVCDPNGCLWFSGLMGDDWGKEWTTEEIYDDVKHVIEQLIEIEESSQEE